MPPFALILPAAGRSTRFAGPRSKLLEPLAGSSVIARALQPFLHNPDLSTVLIPCNDPESIQQAIESNDPRIHFCEGGESRAHSVYHALKQVPPQVEWVSVHDAARPLVSPELIESTLRAAQQYGAAVPALAVHLTIKRAEGPLPAQVRQTVPRHQLWAMQTPQVMRRADLLAAFDTCPIPFDQVTDDVQFLELNERAVWLVPGEEKNIKITTAMDLQIARLWLDALKAPVERTPPAR